MVQFAERGYSETGSDFQAKNNSRRFANRPQKMVTRSVGLSFMIIIYLFSLSVLAYHYTNPVMRERCASHGYFQREIVAFAASRSEYEENDSQSDPEEDGGLGGDKSNEQVISELLSRVGRLELYVAQQEVEIHKLKKQNVELTEAALAFGRVIQLLRQAGLDPEMIADVDRQQDEQKKHKSESTRKEENVKGTPTKPISEALDDSLIFGSAPSSVIDAADAAGASILAAMLGGKQRMLVDVRDAELSSNAETLVQFIELAILPIAAGLEGLKSTRNRVKIVFPKVSQLLEYRRTMALAAPEVVALSTLGFDPVEKRDKLVVIVAPAPDDEEGLTAMRELLAPSNPEVSPIQQPVVILNYHMLPVLGLSDEFETAYHLRLLSVQYMSGENAGDFFRKVEEELQKTSEKSSDVVEKQAMALSNETIPDDGALEAAMKRAHEVGMNQGVTRGMVIRAYPR